MLPTLLLTMALTAGSAAASVPAGQSSERSAAATSAAVDETVRVDVPPATDKALQYRASGNILWVVEQVWSMLVLVVLLATGFSARMRNWSLRVGRWWFPALVVYFILFTVITTVVDLPRQYYVDFIRPHAYGLSNQASSKWWTDTLISLGLSCLIGPLVVWVPYLLLRKSPRRWWLYTAMALVPFIVVGALIEPIWIEPLFNKFEPMQNKTLESRILTLADRAGIQGSRVFEVNKSVDTKTLNAYVAGVFNTKRIVLWDTTIARMDERELLFVMGHEMGHYALGHVWQEIVLSSLVLLLLLYLAYRTAGTVLARYGSRFGFSSLSDIASLPLVMALMAVFSFAITPFELAFTRYVEHEADRFGLEITQTSHSAGTAFVKLQTDALGVPRPGLLYKIWRESHPPLGERIDFANDYHPWRDGRPVAYGDRFKP
jgi:Zn-dependent protease with chaperone function